MASEKMTVIRLPGQRDWSGLGEWGECTAEEMIDRARKYGARLKLQGELIEQAADADFQIDLQRGVHRTHHIREVQKSALTQPTGSADLEGGE